MKQVTLGFVPTRRNIFSAPAAVEYADLTRKRLEQLGVRFVDVTGINPEGLFYDEADRAAVSRRFREAHVDGLLIAHCNFGTEYVCARLAKELNVPMIALSQLSRATEMRGGSKRPQLSDLRESGAIEQDADIVAFIHRPEYYGINQDENGMPTAGMAEIILAKHRNGAVCDVNLRFLKEQARFADVEDSMLPPAQAAESQQAYDDYASGSNSQPGTSGLGAAMGGEFDVNRSTKIDDEAPF